MSEHARGTHARKVFAREQRAWMAPFEERSPVAAMCTLGVLRGWMPRRAGLSLRKGGASPSLREAFMLHAANGVPEGRSGCPW